MLIGFTQKGMRKECNLWVIASQIIKSAGVVKESNPFVFIVRNVETPYRPKQLDNRPRGLSTTMWEQEVGKSKCYSVME
jgi:hypothetical protein